MVIKVPQCDSCAHPSRIILLHQDVSFRTACVVVPYYDRQRIITTFHIATIYVGEERREFTVELDTGSSTFVLPSAKCDSCVGRAKFQCQRESNYSTYITYMVGNGSGRFCEDEVRFAGLTVEHQQMVLLDEEDEDLQLYESDGTIGLGFNADSLLVPFLSEIYTFVPIRVTYAPTPFIQNIRLQGLVTPTVFAFHFTRDGGEFTLGGSDPAHYQGNLAYADVIPFQTSWSVRLEGFHIGSIDAGNCGNKHCSVVIDSGSAFISVPDSFDNTVFLTLNSMVPHLGIGTFGKSNSTGVRFYVRENEIRFLKPIHISIAGSNFTLQPEDYTSPANIPDKEDLYQIEIAMYPAQSWILGKTFMRKVFTEFDVDRSRIGFAPSK
ncbi:renin-like isoform X2 [Periplaneta americana]|uniref:renin-like isoform X2 n=1 Tax=Periplaneta americana TaxID=6978 RepID=UPI0037E8210A